MKLPRVPHLVAAAFTAMALFSVEPGLSAQKPKTTAAPQKPKPKPAAKKTEPVKETPAAPPKPSGLTMRTSYTAADGQTTDTTLASNGVRQRVDLGGGVSVVTQCDTKQILQINDKAKTYVALPFETAAAAPAPAATSTPAKRGGVVEFVTTSTDTGEHKDLFGLSARHITTVVTKTASPEACDKKKERVQTDGWYAALPIVLACTPASPAPVAPASDCHDERRSSSVGEPPAESPLGYTTTTFGDDGKEVASIRMSVTALTVAPVDAALLDAPAGYAKAVDAKAFLAAVERAANEERWGAAKAPGVTRIGVAMPANKTDQSVSVDAVNTELLEGLTSAPFEAVPLQATAPAEQEAEARARGCDYVLALEVASLKTTAPGKVGGLVRKASGGGSPTELHEVKVEYRLFAPGSTGPRPTKSASAKTDAFTLKRALGLARFAARLYFGTSTGMLRMMMNQAGTAGIGLPTKSADPSLNAVSFVMNLLSGGTPEPVNEMSREAALSAAVHNASADVLKDLAAKK